MSRLYSNCKSVLYQVDRLTDPSIDGFSVPNRTLRCSAVLRKPRITCAQSNSGVVHKCINTGVVYFAANFMIRKRKSVSSHIYIASPLNDPAYTQTSKTDGFVSINCRNGTKINELEFPVFCQQNIVSADIPMEDPFFVNFDQAF